MWLKKMKKRKVQSVLIVLIVMLCSMLMTSAITIMTSWGQPYKDLQEECKSPDVKVYLQVDTEEMATSVKDKFESIPEVRNAEILENVSLAEVKMQDGKKIEGFLNLVAYNENMYQSVRMLEGTIHGLKEGECAIPAVIANRNNLKPGDKISISTGESFFIKGIYADPYNMSASFNIDIVVKEIPENMKQNFTISVFSDEAVSGSEIIDLYREANEGILEGRGVSIETRISNNQMTEQILGGILLAMSILIMMVGGVMIRYMIKNLLLSERTTIAIYKTLGYENKVITGIYLKLYLVLVVMGSVLGALLSKFISDAFTRTTFQNLGITASRGVVESGMLCIGAITLYVMLQVYLVIRKTKNIRPIEVFRGEKKITVRKKARGARNISFSPFAMAIRMITREYKNTAIIIITCMMAIYCVNFGGTAMSMMDGMKDMNYYWIGFDKHDVSLEAENETDFEETIGEIKMLPETDRVVCSSADLTVSLPWKKGMGDVIMSAMTYETYENVIMPCLEGRNPRYSGEIAISNAMAKRMKKTTGDYIDIYLQGDKKITLLICGTFQGYFDLGNSCRMLEGTWTENNVSVDYLEAGIYLKNGVTQKEFVDKYKNTYAGKINIFPREEKFKNIMEMITGPQMMALRPFIAMALLLGALNIIAVVYLKNKDYSKIFSIYKAVGYSARFLMKTNIMYILLISVGTIVITVPSFIYLFPKTMAMAMSFIGFKEFPVTYDPLVLIVCNGTALLVFTLCGVISSKSIYHNPIEDLTSE